MRARGVTLRLGSLVSGVQRDTLGVNIRVEGSEWEWYDEVVFATHSNDTLRLLSDASGQEHVALASVGYQPNDVVLHADTNIMPKRRAVWSSWNYTEAPAKREGQIDVTYWMNSLQPIPQDDPMFVTLNSTRPIREELIYDQVTLYHPVYDLAAFNAQKTLREINGTRNTWFCGAWMQNGFHEDGLASGLAVADAIKARSAMAMAAE